MKLAESGLSAEVINNLRAIFKKHPEIDKVILYGSRAKGNHKLGSDVDLTIVSNSLTVSQLLGIENEIDELLLPYKVDLSIYTHIESPDLIAHIKRVGIDFFP
jgi:predicted nucleotidyltransferase